MLFVVFDLFDAAIFGDVDQFLDRIGDFIREQNDFAVYVTSSTTRSLDEAGFAAEKAFFISIENANEADLGQIETFT